MKPIKAVCYLCEQPLKRTSFDIVLGTFATFLCDKDFKKIAKMFRV